MFKWIKELFKREEPKQPSKELYEDYVVLNNSLEDFDTGSQTLSACDNRVRN